MKRKTVVMRAGLLVAGLMILAVHASAAPIVYVDATDGAGGNTTLVDGSQWDPLTADQGVANDGVWARRAFGNGATIYQNAASGAVDNAHRLKTTVSGLAPGTYNVFAYYWSDTSNWRIQASLTDNPGGDLPLYVFQPLPAGGVQYYTGADATVDSSSLAPNPFTSAVRIAEGNRRLLQTPLLGQVTGTSFSVYIDDSSMQVDQNERTWYDGVGYELVPEPTAITLLGIGIAVLMAGRRSSPAATDAA